jgi:uncharacterized membrane protein YfcA
MGRPQFGGMTESSTVIGFAALVFVLAGMVKGVLGVGLPTIAVGLLSIVMSPAESVALMLVPALLTNVWQAFAGRYFWRILRRLWPTFVGILAGTFIASRVGLGLLSPEAASGTRVALGITLLIYAVIGLARVKLHVPAGAEPWLGSLVGLLTGMLSAVTGVYMIPAVPYYQAVGFDPDEFVQAQGLSYTVSTLALMALLLGGNVLDKSNMSASVIAVIPAVLGMVLGQAIRNAVRPEVFRLCFYLGMGALGAHLAFIYH